MKSDMYGVLFTLPPAATMMASTSEYAGPLVSDFLPFIFFTLGVVLGLTIVATLIYVVTSHSSHHN